MIRKVLVSIVLIAAALGISGAVAGWLTKNRPEPERSTVVSRAPLVSVVRLEPSDYREMLRGFGTVRAEQQATLSAEVSAPVLSLAEGIDEGVTVEVGQLLVTLDARQYVQQRHEAQANQAAIDAQLAQLRVERQSLRSLLEIAEADLELNREERDRVKDLFERELAPRTEYNDARLVYQNSLRVNQLLMNQLAGLEPRKLQLNSELAGAVARVEQAELDIERCRITAPFAGQIISRDVEIGDKVRVGTMLVRIVNLDVVEIPVALPLACRTRTQVGADVVLYSDNLPDLRWYGQVARIAPIADAMSRTFEIYLQVDNRRQVTPLVPGFFVKAEVAGSLLQAALAVPRNAVIDDHVFVVNDDHAHPRDVHVVRYLDDLAVIQGNVHSGDAVIISNLDMLYEGAAIRLSREQVTAAPSPDATSVALREEARS